MLSLASSNHVGVVVSPFKYKLTDAAYGSPVIATVIAQLIVRVAVALVLAAVAVINVDVVPATVGVPATELAVRLNPVGSALAAYVTDLPAALDALSVTAAIGSPVVTE